jgi:HEAT repeat protein
VPGKLALLGKLTLFGCAAGGAALIAVYSGSPTRHEEETETRSRAPAQALSVSGEELQFRPVAGQRYTYQFQRKISFEGTLGGASLPEAIYGGDLHIDVLRADKTSFTALVSERLNQNAKASPYVKVEVSAMGESLSLFSAPGLNDEEKQHVAVIKDLLSLWLFPLRSDTVGAFEASFESLPAEKGFLLGRKTKTSYLSRAVNTPVIVSSLHLLRWDSGLHLPAEVKGKESTRLGGGDTSLLSQTGYGIRFRGQEKMPAVNADLLASLSKENPLALDTTAPDLAAHPDYAKIDWGGVLSRLRGIQRLSGEDQLKLFGDLVKYLRVHPEAASDLAAMLKDPSLLRQGSDAQLFKTLVGALATSGSPEALQALRSAYDDPNTSIGGKATILAALTTTQAPLDTATTEFLAKKMGSEQDASLAQAAAFALGSALQSAGNSPQATNAIAQINAAWAAAQGNIADQLNLLDVMGNSGRSEFLPLLQQIVDEKGDVNVRARALFALRFVKDPSVSTILIARLADAESVLREAAAEAMGLAGWTESFRAPLERCQSGESVDRIQSSCEKTLSSNPRVAGN